MGGLVIMYSKKIYLREKDIKQAPPSSINKYFTNKPNIKQSVLNNSPVSKNLIDKLTELYDPIEYSKATKYLFGNPSMVITKLTEFQAELLIVHAIASSPVAEKKEKKKPIKPYKNIWKTLER